MKMISEIFSCKDESEDVALKVNHWSFSNNNEVMLDISDQGMGLSQHIFISNKAAIQLANSILNQLEE